MSEEQDPVVDLVNDADKLWSSSVRSLHGFRRLEEALRRLGAGQDAESCGLPDVRLVFPFEGGQPSVEVSFPVAALEPEQIAQVFAPMVQAEKLWFLDGVRELGEKLRSVYTSVFATLRAQPVKEADGAES